jgi:hypothetical protein
MYWRAGSTSGGIGCLRVASISERHRNIGGGCADRSDERAAGSERVGKGAEEPGEQPDAEREGQESQSGRGNAVSLARHSSAS